jgi:hypothetical protein
MMKVDLTTVGDDQFDELLPRRRTFRYEFDGMVGHDPGDEDDKHRLFSFSFFDEPVEWTTRFVRDRHDAQIMEYIKSFQEMHETHEREHAAVEARFLDELKIYDIDWNTDERKVDEG